MGEYLDEGFSFSSSSLTTKPPMPVGFNRPVNLGRVTRKSYVIFKIKQDGDARTAKSKLNYFNAAWMKQSIDQNLFL